LAGYGKNRIGLPMWCIPGWCMALLLCIESYAAQSTVNTFEPAITQNKSYTEIHTLTALCEDNTFIQILMTITNLGLTDKNATAKMLVLNGSGKPFKGNMWYDQKKWSYCCVPEPALTIGSCRIVQLKDKVVFSGSLDGAKIKVTIPGVAAPLKPPHAAFNCKQNIQARTKVKNTFFENEILIPWSRVRVVMHLPGKPQKKLHAYGMLEHSRCVGHPREISRGWVTFRGGRNGAYFLANFRLPPDEKTCTTGWIWKTGNAAPVAVQGLKISGMPKAADGKNGKTHEVSDPRGSFCISGVKCLYRYSFIDELGPLLGPVVKCIVGNPITSYYEAQVTLAGEEAAMQGVLELMSIE